MRNPYKRRRRKAKQAERFKHKSKGGHRKSARRDAKPRVSLKEQPFKLHPREQTAVTQAIIDFASQFPGRNLHTVQLIVNEIAGFRQHEMTEAKAKEYFAKRTAEQIIRARSIVTYSKGFLARFGCAEMCVALKAVLKAKGIRSSFVAFKQKSGWHTVVHFWIGGKLFKADPFADKIEKRVVELNKKDLNRIERMKQMGIAFEGENLWELGIKDWKDVLRFDRKSK